MKFTILKKLFSFILKFITKKNTNYDKDNTIEREEEVPDYEGDDKMAAIKRIIIHCSDSSWADAEEIKDWHVNGNGWRDIGYHYVILNGRRKSSKDYDDSCDGLIEAGRSMDNDIEIEGGEAGAHAAGFNSDSIGICLVGKDKFTKEQVKSLIIICSFWKKLIPNLEINGHYQFSSKSCPNFEVDELKELIDESDLSTHSLEELVTDLEESIKIV